MLHGLAAILSSHFVQTNLVYVIYKRTLDIPVETECVNAKRFCDVMMPMLHID